jgi:hypothetical protein
MITTQDSLPVIDSCGCTSQGVSPAASRRNTSFPDHISLEPLTASLASAEVARIREILGVGQEGQAKDDVSDERLILKSSESMFSADAELRPDKARGWLSFKSLCKELWSCMKDAVLKSWIVENIKCQTEKLIQSAGKCVSYVREFVRDSLALPKGTLKGIASGSKLQQIEPAVSIPRIVVKRRPEESRSEGRRRSRFIVRRGKQPDEDQEFINPQDEVEVPLSRKERQLTADGSAQEKRISQARTRIRDIDAQYGTTPNNAKVADLLAQLGTHYDSIERAIETVYAIQLEELLEEQRKHLAQTRAQAFGLSER